MFSAYHRIGENRYRQRIGLDFEDFAAGLRFRHRPGLTLSQQDNADEALDTQNGAMLHYDAHYAAATAWQNPLMVSTLTLQRLIGMASKTYGRRSAILGFDDIAMNGMDLIREIVDIYDNYDFTTEVLVASCRHPIHVVEAARMGADIATCPPAVIDQLFNHPLTNIGLEKFLKDWEKSQAVKA